MSFCETLTCFRVYAGTIICLLWIVLPITTFVILQERKSKRR